MTPEGVKTSRSDKSVTERYRAETPGDRHRFADRAPRFGRVGEAPAVRVIRRRSSSAPLADAFKIKAMNPSFPSGYIGFRVIGVLKLLSGAAALFLGIGILRVFQHDPRPPWNESSLTWP